MSGLQSRSMLEFVPLPARVTTREPGADRFLIFGENALSSAEWFRMQLPFVFDATCSFREALSAVHQRPYGALFAASPMTEPGSAAELIREFRARNPHGATIYQGWDYRIEISGPKAHACEADFLLVGGTLRDELLHFLEVAIRAKRGGFVPSPPTVAWYEGFLNDCFPQSPFWQLAQSFRMQGLPPSLYE